MESVVLTVSDLTGYVGSVPRLTATLKDLFDNPLDDKTIKFTINGIAYDRVTGDDGVARLNINLPVGVYPTTVAFEGDSTYSSATRNVTVMVLAKETTILLVSDYTKNYGEAGALKATLMKTDTTPLPNRNIVYTINGVTYTRVTNNDGEASLNINLPVGEYWTKVEFMGDATQDYRMQNVTVKVKSPTHMDGTNIHKMEDETVVYQCAVYDVYGRRVDCDVAIKVNGVTYNRHTDEQGLAKLNIRLPAGNYILTATFAGDNMNNGSSVTNTVNSIPYIRELTTNYNGVSYSSNNQGFMKSHIMVKQWTPEEAKSRNGLIFWDDTNMKFHKDIPFESYEITETDPRTKTAKFVTSEYFDLTAGQLWCYISSPYHENFGGRILKVDFDKDKGLYTYQCQDGRRQYLTKIKNVCKNNVSTYQWVEFFLTFPNLIGGSYKIPISDEIRNNPRNQQLLSGLRPIDDYYVSAETTFSNYNFMEYPVGEFLSYDSLIDNIMNFTHQTNSNCVDVYFSPEGICQIEPVDLEKWLKTGLRIRHQDLVQYKYGFDTTNIITAVGVKDAKNAMKWYGKADMMYYFGYVDELIDPVTSTTTNESTISTSSSSSGGTGANKGKTVIVGCDTNVPGSDAAWRDTTADALRAAGYTVETLSVGSNYFANYDWHGPSQGKVGVYLMADSTVSIADYACHDGFDYAVFGIRGDAAPKAVAQWDTAPWAPDGDCNSVCNKWAYKTGQEKDDMLNEMGRGRVVKGSSAEELANVIVAAVNGDPNPTASSGGGSTQTTTTTVIDEVASYNKAMEKLVESTRSLLSFEIKLPLNDPLFKNVHTNQLLWTELPRDFKLGNLKDIFTLNPIYKNTRGLQYQENRWYIEKMVTKCDSSGLMGTLTLNAFPSSYSSYANAFKAYAKAYDQDFKQQEAQQNNTTTSSGGGGGAREPRLGDDSTDTGDIACATGRYHGHAGDNENFDNCAQKGYARQGASYFDWARQFNTPIELAKALNNMYEEVTHYNHWDSNAEETFNKGWGNCWDGCRMVKCCFDAAGFDCIIVTGEIYGWSHGWNAVKWNGRWYTFDLLFDYTSAGDWGGTNTLRMADEW